VDQYLPLIEPYVPLIFLVLSLLGSFGLLLSGIAATKQARLGKKLFKLRCEQMNRER